MRETPQEGIDLIKHFEGFSPVRYICSGGKVTIGYGHVVLDGERLPGRITEEHAERILRADLRIAERSVLRLINVPLTDGQYAALVSFTFNLGGGALQRSTLRMVVNREEHADAPAQFMRWVYAGGRKQRGLIRRRAAEAELFLS